MDTIDMSFPVWLVTNMPEHGRTDLAVPVILDREGKNFIFVEADEEAAVEAAVFLRQQDAAQFPFFGVLELYTENDLKEIVDDGQVDFVLSGIAGLPENYILWEQRQEEDYAAQEGIQPENYQSEHKDRDSGRQTAKTGSCDCPEYSGEVKEINAAS